MRVIGRKTAGSAPAKPAADATKKPPQRREPVIKLASIPRGHAAPTAAPKSNEPAPQKPEIRLTPEQFAAWAKVVQPPRRLRKAEALPVVVPSLLHCRHPAMVQYPVAVQPHQVKVA